VHLPAFSLGERAGNMLMKVIRGEKMKAPRILLPTELVIRNSTCPFNG